MYSTLVYKATRGAQTLAKGLSKEEDAIAHATEWYENGQVFFIAKLLHSGVAMLVMTDEDAAQIDGKGIVMLDTEKVLFQAGGY